MLTRDLDGYYISPHTDTDSKIVTVQFYLAEDDSQRGLGTTLYRQQKRFALRRRFWKPRMTIQAVSTLPFAANSGYAFAVTRESFHGVETVTPGHFGRNSLFLVYYVDPSHR
jgi:hypothetical protein